MHSLVFVCFWLSSLVILNIFRIAWIKTIVIMLIGDFWLATSLQFHKIPKDTHLTTKRIEMIVVDTVKMHWTVSSLENSQNKIQHLFNYFRWLWTVKQSKRKYSIRIFTKRMRFELKVSQFYKWNIEHS